MTTHPLDINMNTLHTTLDTQKKTRFWFWTISNIRSNAEIKNFLTNTKMHFLWLPLLLTYSSLTTTPKKNK